MSNNRSGTPLIEDQEEEESTEEEEKEAEKEEEEEEEFEEKTLPAELSQFSTLLLTTASEGGGDFTSNITLLNAVRGIFILQAVAGLGIVLSDGYETLQTEDASLANIIKIIRENDDFFYAAYSFASGINPNLMGNRGFVSLLIALNNEQVYRSKEKEKKEKYYKKREDAEEEINKLIELFNQDKVALIEDFEKKKAGLKREDELILLDDLEKNLNKLQKKFQEAINELKQCVASKAASLQYFQSNRRLERCFEMMDIGLSTALFHCPPAYLASVYVGFLMSETAEFATFFGARTYIENTAKANHGLRTDPIIILGDEEHMERAFSQKRQVNNICLVLQPPLIKEKKVTDAIKKTSTCARFSLLLPNKFSTIEKDSKEAEIEAALRNLFDNYIYFLEFVKAFDKKYDKQKQPDFLNLKELQNTFKRNAASIRAVIVERDLPVVWAEYWDRIDDILKDKEYVQTETPVSFIYVSNLGQEIIRDLENCLLFVSSLQEDQIIENASLIIKELNHRIKRYEELCEKNAGIFLVSESNKLFEIEKRMYLMWQRLEPMLQEKTIKSSEKDRKSSTEDRIKKLREVEVYSAPGHSTKLEENQTLIIPERRAFGLTKRRQLKKQVTKTLQKIKEKTEIEEIIISPYAEFKSEDIRDARDGKILRDKIEGLKTELQWLNLFLKLQKSQYQIVNKSKLINYYTQQITLMEKSIERIQTMPPEPKGFSKVRKFFSVLGTRMTNLARLPMAERELRKVKAEFALLRKSLQSESTKDIEDSMSRTRSRSGSISTASSVTSSGSISPTPTPISSSPQSSPGLTRSSSFSFPPDREEKLRRPRSFSSPSTSNRK